MVPLTQSKALPSLPSLPQEAHEAYTRAMVLDKGEIVHPLNRALCNIRLENWAQGLQDCEAVLKVPLAWPPKPLAHLPFPLPWVIMNNPGPQNWCVHRFFACAPGRYLSCQARHISC